MQRFIKKRSRKAGLPPGTLVHIGEQKTEEVRITVMDYDEARFQEEEIETVEECFRVFPFQRQAYCDMDQCGWHSSG